MPIRTKQFCTNFLKNGKCKNFSILYLDNRIASNSSWDSTYFCTLEGLFLNLSVSEPDPELDRELPELDRRLSSFPLPLELELELDLCDLLDGLDLRSPSSSFSDSFFCLSASLRSFSCLLAFNSDKALDF